jgi:hypothetical protein
MDKPGHLVKNRNTSSQVFTRNFQNEALEFLKSLGPFHYSVTVNLKKRSSKFNVYSSHEQWEKSAQWFISALNRKILKRAYRHGHQKLNSISAIEIGSLNKRPHIHMALGLPMPIAHDRCMQAIVEVHQKMDWSYGDIHVMPYQNSGWINYIMKEGFDRVVLH